MPINGLTLHSTGSERKAVQAGEFNVRRERKNIMQKSMRMAICAIMSSIILSGCGDPNRPRIKTTLKGTTLHAECIYAAELTSDTDLGVILADIWAVVHENPKAKELHFRIKTIDKDRYGKAHITDRGDFFCDAYKVTETRKYVSADAFVKDNFHLSVELAILMLDDD
jgi:hypothetical protein